MCTYVDIACGLSERSGGPGDWGDGAGGRDEPGHGGPGDSAGESGQDDLVNASTQLPVPSTQSQSRATETPDFDNWQQKRNQHTIACHENRAGQRASGEESRQLVAANELTAPLHLGHGSCFCVLSPPTSLACRVRLSGRSVGCRSGNDAAP